MNLVTFLLSRTVGLPQIGEDAGNWTEPLGFATLAAEALTIALTALVFSHASTPHGQHVQEMS